MEANKTASTPERTREVMYTRGYNPTTGRLFTLAVLIRNGNTYFGSTECSTKDQFSKKRGREIALVRAIHGPHTIKYKMSDKKKAYDYMCMIRALYSTPPMQGSCVEEADMNNEK